MHTVVPITEDEIQTVLSAHLRRAGDIDDGLLDQAYRYVRAENARVQKCAAHGKTPEEQLDKALIEIEAILFEQGILDGVRRFGDPLASWLLADGDEDDDDRDQEEEDEELEDDDFEDDDEKVSYWDIERQYEED